MDLAFFKELHDKEFSRKDRLAQRATTIITAMTTIGGLLAFVVVNYKRSGGLFDVAFGVLSVLSFAAFLRSVIFLVWSYRVPALNQIPSSKDWLIFWEELTKKYKEGTGAFASADAEFTDYLIRLYAEVSELNIDSNDKRGARLVKSNNALLASFVLLVLTALCFYYNNYIHQT